MRRKYDKQLEDLHTGLIRMGSLCEEAIANAAKALFENSDHRKNKVADLEHEINITERELEQMCVRLLLLQQPMAGDLRQITAAQKMIADMERIGDQAADIAELAKFTKKSTVKKDIQIEAMAKAVIIMVRNSLNSFVLADLEKAKYVIEYDNKVDSLFDEIKNELSKLITQNNKLVDDCLDLLMIAKYLERIGDHAENIAQWVLYSITGNKNGKTLEENK